MIDDINDKDTSRDPERIPVIIVMLLVHWSQHPEQRLGQLLSNLVPLRSPFSGDLFYLEDDILQAELQVRTDIDEQMLGLL